jgi:hypothetical protein
MKLNYAVLLISAAITLLGVSGCLLRQNQVCSENNRRLILENDSLLSVNIELTRRLSVLKKDSLTNGKLAAFSQ